jgi:hypothetical protein
MSRYLVLTVALIVGTPALAQDGGALDFDLEGGGDSDATVIKGEEHRPDFTVLIDRENLSKAYEMELKESFLPKIQKALERAPF